MPFFISVRCQFGCYLAFCEHHQQLAEYCATEKRETLHTEEKLPIHITNS
jgi:hypothetical protein